MMTLGSVVGTDEELADKVSTTIIIKCRAVTHLILHISSAGRVEIQPTAVPHSNLCVDDEW